MSCGRLSWLHHPLSSAR